jgi:hypothetical protein
MRAPLQACRVSPSKGVFAWGQYTLRQDDDDEDEDDHVPLSRRRGFSLPLQEMTGPTPPAPAGTPSDPLPDPAAPGGPTSPKESAWGERGSGRRASTDFVTDIDFLWDFNLESE